jgi:membrane-bound lytic murein transglycosylase MltF
LSNGLTVKGENWNDCQGCRFQWTNAKDLFCIALKKRISGCDAVHNRVDENRHYKGNVERKWQSVKKIQTEAFRKNKTVSKKQLENIEHFEYVETEKKTSKRV